MLKFSSPCAFLSSSVFFFVSLVPTLGNFLSVLKKCKCNSLLFIIIIIIKWVNMYCLSLVQHFDSSKSGEVLYKCTVIFTFFKIKIIIIQTEMTSFCQSFFNPTNQKN